MLALTSGLGVWQLQRLTWKRDLLAAIDRGEAASPVPLTESALPFRRVRATGSFLPDEARYGVELRSVAGTGPVLGSHVLAILVPATGASVIVDRGWAPSGTPMPAPSGPVEIEGYVRPPEHRPWFGPKDDEAARLFYTLDPGRIGAALGRPDVAAFTLVALGASTAPPLPATTLPRPPNDHLSYAVTWFGLAAALLVVFAIYTRASLRPASNP